MLGSAGTTALPFAGHGARYDMTHHVTGSAGQPRSRHLAAQPPQRRRQRRAAAGDLRHRHAQSAARPAPRRQALDGAAARCLDRAPVPPPPRNQNVGPRGEDGLERCASTEAMPMRAAALTSPASSSGRLSAYPVPRRSRAAPAPARSTPAAGRARLGHRAIDVPDQGRAAIGHIRAVAAARSISALASLIVSAGAKVSTRNPLSRNTARAAALENAPASTRSGRSFKTSSAVPRTTGRARPRA